MEPRIKQCYLCQSDMQSVSCMRDTDPDGICQIADDSPEPLSFNRKVIEIFEQAKSSAEQIEGKDKFYKYLRPGDLEALMRIHGVPEYNRPEMLYRLFLLQDISNDLRRRKKKPKNSRQQRRIR